MGQGLSSQQQFPYVIGNAVSDYLGKSIWTLHTGTKKDDGSTVSIFSFDSKKNPSKLEVAKNGFKRAKTIRHPNFLTYLDGIELPDGNIYIVTEPIQPLDDQIEDIKKYENAISWGIYQITKALSFLNNINNLTHGNINMTTIFITKAGDWKLGSLDLLSNLKEINSSILKNHNDLIPVKYRPPEISKSQWNFVTEQPSYSIDSWMLGCLLYECYNGPMSKSEDVRDLTLIPKQLQPHYQKCFGSKPESRLNPNKFLESPYFQNLFVETCVFLENITLKDNFEKESFYKKLDQHIDKLPGNICKFKIIPHLITAFDFGPINLKILGIILKVSSNLTAEEYSLKIIPSVLKWFASDDRALRINLLENLEHYIQHLSADLINNQIFQHVINGFNDNPTLKELTIKSMLLFAPKLSEKNITQLLKYFAALQKDPLPGIRTNTTICLGRITECLSDDTKKKVLIPAFSTALKDPFIPHQSAGISAFLFTISQYNAEQIATRIVPELSQCLINPDRSVRNSAFQAIQTFLSKLEKLVENLESPPSTPQSSSMPFDLNNSGGSGGNTSDQQTPGSGNDSMLGWAFNYTKKLYNESTSNKSTPPSSLSSSGNSSSQQPIKSNQSSSNNSPSTISNSNINKSTPPTLKSGGSWDDDDIDFQETKPKSKSTLNNKSSTTTSNKPSTTVTSNVDEDDEDYDNYNKNKLKNKEDLPKMVIKSSSNSNSNVNSTTSSGIKGKGMQIQSKKQTTISKIEVFDNESSSTSSSPSSTSTSSSSIKVNKSSGWDDDNIDIDIPSSTTTSKSISTSSTAAAKKSVSKITSNDWENWD